MTKTDRNSPLVSFVLLAYNQEKFIYDAVEGALAQNYSEVEVIISDDHSTDRTWRIIEERTAAYCGPHKIIARRNSQNLGLSEHFNRVLEVSSGDIIVIASGDDISLPSRSRHAVDLFAAHPSASAVLCSAWVVNTATEVISNMVLSGRNRPDHDQNLTDLLTRKYVTFGAGRSIRREVFERFGDLSPSCPTEDTPLLLRSLLLGPNLVSHEKHVYYRTHARNLSGPNMVYNLNVDAIHSQYRSDIARAVELKIINARTADQIENWIKSDGYMRTLKASIQAGENPDFGLILRLIKDSQISSYRKIRIVTKYCIARARKSIYA